MRWKVKRTRWGWTLFYDGEMVVSADHPLELALFPAVLQMQDNTRSLTRQ